MGNSDRRKFFTSVLSMISRGTWISLVLAVITLAPTASSSEPRVVCYYTNWSVYRPGTAKFNPQNINPYLCTHLIYAFGGFTKDNTLKPFDKYQDIEKGGYAKFTGLKTYNKNLKTLLAIGGWNEGSSRFSPMVAEKSRRKEFVRNCIKFLRQNRFDGLDLDWEYPAFRDGGKPKDRENYAKLVRELRDEFEKEAQKTGKPRLLLTMAVPAGIEYIQKGFDVVTLNKYLDWMNLLTYDYHSAFEPAVNHHAPLFPLEEPNEYSVDNELNIDYTIKFYLESGADRDKLVLGIPTYGRSYTLFNPDAKEIGSPADGPGEQGDATREKGYLAYYEICEALKQKVKKRAAADDSDEDDSEEEEEEEEVPWTVMHPNPSAMGPVAYKGNQWVGYDDMAIVKKKAEYVAQNGLGGIMFWSIDNDDFRGTCHGKPYPLIEAAKESYIQNLGSTDNVVVTDKPRSVASSSGNRRKSRPRASSTTAKPTTTTKASKTKSSPSSTTPSWNIITPEPPTTPDPGSDFKCKDEGFFQHPRDCKKYFWCLDSGPSNLGIVAHQFTCPSGLFFNKAADSCDFSRNVLCKIKSPDATTKAPTTKAATTKEPTTTTTEATTTRRAVKLSTRNSALFRTTSTTSTTPEPEAEEYEDEVVEDSADIDAEDPKVIKELIDLIRKVGGVEQLEKQLHLGETSASTDGGVTTTQSSFNKKLYQKVLERTRGANKFTGNSISSDSLSQNSRRGPQNAGIEASSPVDQKVLRRDRPQYTSINRARGPSSTTTEEALEDQEDVQEVPQTLFRARNVESGDTRVGTTAKPLQYVNIRRARPTTVSTSDTADDTASRNALFERSEPYVSVSETVNNLDIASARRENIPEYVTIRRQRPTTEEATTIQSQIEEEAESLESIDKEISSPPSQPQYTSIVRSRSTTLPPTDEPSSPEPTTVLAVQISSLLNTPTSEDSPTNTIVDEPTEKTEETEPPTTSTSTSTTTATPSSSATTRRTLLRRRGSTTASTSAPASSTTQNPKDRRNSFLRRTKATAPPEVTEPLDVTTESSSDASTSKYTRRGGSKFKTPRPKAGNEKKEIGAIDGAKIENGTREPSANGTQARNERPTRNFVRRRLGGGNATSSTTAPASASSLVSSPSTPSSPTTRKSFRIVSRRRPTAGSTTSTSSATQTPVLLSEESLQDIDERESIEDPALKGRAAPTPKKIVKIQRRPLSSLKGKEDIDQNPSATNENRKGHSKDASKTKDEEKTRQSKKYSSSFKQNQLDEVIRQKSKSSEEFDVTTTERGTTFDDLNSETAVVLAAHQLLAAPIPSFSDIEQTRTSSKQTPNNYQTTQEYRYTSPDYTEITKIEDIEIPKRRVPVLSTTQEYSSTPNFKTTSYYSVSSPAYGTGYPETSSGYSSVSSTPLPRTSSLSNAAYTIPSLASFATGQRPSGFTSSQGIVASPAGFSGVSQPLGPSSAKYLGVSEKLVPVPVEEYGYSTDGYNGGLSQEPSYFTREYLLESPVTKTYDDEYQYLSPITTPQTTTRKALKKTVFRKISTTIPPTSAVPVLSTPKPRRVVSRKPFEKVPKAEPNRTYRPMDNYDYYDDSDEKVVGNGKYAEGIKVVVHAKGTIECLDIGNFPHPSACNKFISCARIDNGSILGWQYVCPKGLSFDPVGGICNWSAGLGCNES